MKIIDCYWEKRNLGCNSVEISIERNDKFKIEDFHFIKDYNYVVAKVPVNKLDFNFGLSDLGFSIVELQMDMYASLKTFNFEEKNIQRIIPYLSFKEVCTPDGVNSLLSKITPGMFSTDRISLDTKFGYEIGCIRYKNWIRDEFEKGTAKIINLFYKNNHVAFAMFRQDQNIKGLVGGLFSDYQNDGIGLITPCLLILYAKTNNLYIKKVINPISSNNKAVWDLYEYFGFVPKNPHYVLVKHNI